MPGRRSLQKRLGYTFKKPELLELALTHPSLSHEQGSKLNNNQRLEFLGDAVLGVVISAELYRKFPHRDEGTLSKARARLVCGPALAEQATAIGLGKELVLSRGEERSGGRTRPGASRTTAASSSRSAGVTTRDDHSTFPAQFRR